MRDVRKTLVWFRFTQSTDNLVPVKELYIPYVNTIAGMSWMRDSYPLHRCFHETHYTMKKISSHNKVLNLLFCIYRAQYAFATLKNSVSLLPPHASRGSSSALAGYQLRLLCNRASRSANTFEISCCPSIFVRTPLA